MHTINTRTLVNIISGTQMGAKEHMRARNSNVSVKENNGGKIPALGGCTLTASTCVLNSRLICFSVKCHSLHV